MAGLGTIGFLSPWLLLALAALPVLWWLLRAVPPAPLRVRFPAVTLLLGLKDTETTPDRTPWWLLLLRMLALAAVIVGFAGPVLNPQDRAAGRGPLLIALDGSWASARDWNARQQRLTSILREARLDGRPTSVVLLTEMPRDQGRLEFSAADVWENRIEALVPNAWEPQYGVWAKSMASAENEPFETLWLSDGLDHKGRAALYDVLSSVGDVTVLQGDREVFALRPALVEDGNLVTTVIRPRGSGEAAVRINLTGPDPAGITRVLSSNEGRFGQRDREASVVFDLPSELRNRVRSVSVEGVRSAGSVLVTDDSLQRRKVALLASGQQQETVDLVSPLHFLRKALVPTADVIEAPLGDLLDASPDVLVFADIGDLNDIETEAVVEWVEQGGMLLRFAGPHLAASEIGLREEHPLLPTRLRAGGRSVGGAMSWGAPKGLRAFDRDSPFFGLKIPDDVSVESQVLAQPDPNLSDRVLAMLEDGTPLVTAKDLGLGRVVLFQTTANTDWTNLPLSGLFVQMLERLAVSTATVRPDAADLEGQVWTPEKVMDGFGVLRDGKALGGIDGAVLAEGIVGPQARPGIYANGDRRIALNVIADGQELSVADWPAGTDLRPLLRSEETPLKPWFLAAAIALLSLDVLGTLWVAGRLKSAGAVRAAGFVLAVALASLSTDRVSADDEAALMAANNTVLAYVLTGDERLDETSRAGLLGLSTELFRRTSIEPIEPVGIALESDELALYPFIYWPMSETQALPSDAAIERVNTYLRTGGMIMFDTRDANLGGSGTANGRKLQQIAARLNVPPLEQVPPDHVLTRSFYLLQDYPGRYANAPVWVEAAPPDAEQVEGVPFRNLNDGVTPVIIGGNDWASAWAIDSRGNFMFPVGRGFAGERQREISLRFGINLIMHVMTGNYKSDQVHVPALLNRLGQ